MYRFHVFTALATWRAVLGQQIGLVPEVHPQLITQLCTTNQGCAPRGTSIVLDYEWRDINDVFTGESCITENGKLNQTICSTSEECGRRCALEGADYRATGVETKGDSVTLHLYQRYKGQLINVQPQIYLLEGGDYAMLKLLNQEVSFDVDVSKAPCGIDAAAYLAGMDPSGGRSNLNPAGATYGTGYCDSECNLGYTFVNGVANINGSLGPCCNEMDLWEANSRSTQLTMHPCNLTGLYACSGNECELGNGGPCARTGCDFNPYGLGVHTFYGEHQTVDTKKPFTVVTQFLTNDETTHGTLVEIRRLYIQNKKLVHNAAIHINGETYHSITSKFCENTAPRQYLNHKHGGLAQMGESLRRGMVLVMGIWDDPGDFNAWLDSGSAGSCSKDQGSPAEIKSNFPDTSVTFSNIRWGDIGSTYKDQVQKGSANSRRDFRISILVIALWISGVAIV